MAGKNTWERTRSGLAVAFFVVVAGCNSSAAYDPESLEFGAFDVCTQFVKDRLAAQYSTAEFPDPTEDDGDVVTARDGDEWTVLSQVDSKNVFGGTATVPFTCTVRHTAGERWRRVDLTVENRSGTSAEPTAPRSR